MIDEKLKANRRIEVTVKDVHGITQLRFQMMDDWEMTAKLIKSRVEVSDER